MKNWNTDTTKFTSPEEKRVWELSQLINYGHDGEKISRREIKKNWDALKPHLVPDRARSLPTNTSFWV